MVHAGAADRDAALMRVALDAGDGVVRRCFWITWEEVAREVHGLNVLLHAEIAHAEEVDARRGIGDIGIELFEERIRVQRRCEACFARAREWRVSRMDRGGSDRSKGGELKKATTVHGVRKASE
jgi:hypothetical protein